jgi:hypothetical protein
LWHLREDQFQFLSLLSRPLLKNYKF